MVELVAGIDGCNDGWVAVLLHDGTFRAAHWIKGGPICRERLGGMLRYYHRAA